MVDYSRQATSFMHVFVHLLGHSAKRSTWQCPLCVAYKMFVSPPHKRRPSSARTQTFRRCSLGTCVLLERTPQKDKDDRPPAPYRLSSHENVLFGQARIPFLSAQLVSCYCHDRPVVCVRALESKIVGLSDGVMLTRQSIGDIDNPCGLSNHSPMFVFLVWLHMVPASR